MVNWDKGGWLRVVRGSGSVEGAPAHTMYKPHTGSSFESTLVEAVKLLSKSDVNEPIRLQVVKTAQHNLHI